MPTHPPTALALLRDAIPLVAGAAERNERFPSPDLHQRVQHLDDDCIYRWTGSAWERLPDGVTSL